MLVNSLYSCRQNLFSTAGLLLNRSTNERYLSIATTKNCNACSHRIIRPPKSAINSVNNLGVKRSLSSYGNNDFKDWKDSSPRNGFTDTVGKTPLIYLKNISERAGRHIYGKAEFMNPGGSVKDRAALYLINQAEEAGVLEQGNPDATVVEGSAGNTGIGLGLISRTKGYKCVVYMPNTQSQEKIDILKTLGCDIRLVSPTTFDDPLHYEKQAAAFAETNDNYIWTNQFENRANRMAHYETTGPEIYAQLNGEIDAFTCAAGTGGTLAGVARYLKEMKNEIRIVLADPYGSVLYSYFTTGEIKRSGSSVVEGIGQGRITGNMDGAAVDVALQVTDEAATDMTFRLLHEEGLFLGMSSGLNVAAAVKVAQNMPENSKIVTILCDGGQRYYSRMYNKEWLRSKNLLDSVPLQYHDTLV